MYMTIYLYLYYGAFGSRRRAPLAQPFAAQPFAKPFDANPVEESVAKSFAKPYAKHVRGISLRPCMLLSNVFAKGLSETLCEQLY